MNDNMGPDIWDQKFDIIVSACWQQNLRIFFFQNARNSRYTLHNIVLHRGYSQVILCCYQIGATGYATLTNGSELYLRLEILRTNITKYAWCYLSFKIVNGRYVLKHWPHRFQSHIINQSNLFEAGNKTCSTNLIGVISAHSHALTSLYIVTRNIIFEALRHRCYKPTNSLGFWYPYHHMGSLIRRK